MQIFLTTNQSFNNSTFERKQLIITIKDRVYIKLNNLIDYKATNIFLRATYST